MAEGWHASGLTQRTTAGHVRIAKRKPSKVRQARAFERGPAAAPEAFLGAEKAPTMQLVIRQLLLGAEAGVSHGWVLCSTQRPAPGASAGSRASG